MYAPGGKEEAFVQICMTLKDIILQVVEDSDDENEENPLSRDYGNIAGM
jgi:hypothetical protein